MVASYQSFYLQQRLLHLRLRQDQDGRGRGEYTAGDPETHREHGHRGCSGEVRQHEEESQIPGGYLWMSILFI